LESLEKLEVKASLAINPTEIDRSIPRVTISIGLSLIVGIATTEDKSIAGVNWLFWVDERLISHSDSVKG